MPAFLHSIPGINRKKKIRKIRRNQEAKNWINTGRASTSKKLSANLLPVNGDEFLVSGDVCSVNDDACLVSCDAFQGEALDLSFLSLPAALVCRSHCPQKGKVEDPCWGRQQRKIENL